jgi:hypothetical protein
MVCIIDIQWVKKDNKLFLSCIFIGYQSRSAKSAKTVKQSTINKNIVNARPDILLNETIRGIGYHG